MVFRKSRKRTVSEMEKMLYVIILFFNFLWMPSKSFLFARIVSIIPALWSLPNFVKGLTIYQTKENKIDWSKSKAHADENINVPEKMIFFFFFGGGGGQKTMWKRRICWFSQSRFSKGLLFKVIKLSLCKLSPNRTVEAVFIYRF